MTYITNVTLYTGFNRKVKMKQIIIIVSLIGIYLSFTSCRPADNRQADYDFTPLDSIITSWMNKGYYPGASICVVRDDSSYLSEKLQRRYP